MNRIITTIIGLGFVLGLLSFSCRRELSTRLSSPDGRDIDIRF